MFSPLVPLSPRLQTQVHVLDSRELQDRPRDAMAALCAFLRIPFHDLRSWEPADVQRRVEHACVAPCAQ